MPCESLNCLACLSVPYPNSVVAVTVAMRADDRFFHPAKKQRNWGLEVNPRIVRTIAPISTFQMRISSRISARNKMPVRRKRNVICRIIYAFQTAEEGRPKQGSINAIRSAPPLARYLPSGEYANGVNPIFVLCEPFEKSSRCGVPDAYRYYPRPRFRWRAFCRRAKRRWIGPSPYDLGESVSVRSVSAS